VKALAPVLRQQVAVWSRLEAVMLCLPQLKALVPVKALAPVLVKCSAKQRGQASEMLFL
jgi:hypothetical protein